MELGQANVSDGRVVGMLQCIGRYLPEIRDMGVRYLQWYEQSAVEMSRFWLFQLFGGFLLCISQMVGFPLLIWDGDVSKLIILILALFLYGIAEQSQKLWKKADDTGNICVLVGLIGTVLGIIVALSGVNPESVADAASVKQVVTTMVQGMGTVYYTTLVGAVALAWMRLGEKFCNGKD